MIRFYLAGLVILLILILIVCLATYQLVEAIYIREEKSDDI